MRIEWLARFSFMAFAIPASSIAQQSAPSLWEHNGSTVYLVANGQTREFYYQEPRPGMTDVGARQGSLLFTGISSNGGYQGTAYIYRGACGRFPYRVSGPILDNYERVVVRGQAPRVGPDCRIRGYFDDTLEFSLIKPAQGRQDIQQEAALSEFYGVWGESPSCNSGMITTIVRDEISLWHKFVSSGSKENEHYGSCTIGNIQRRSSTKALADLVDCDHPGHKKSDVIFEKLSASSIETPFGTLYRCRGRMN